MLDVADPRNLVGLIIGAAVVFLFSGLAINAVSRAAGAVIFEVRRQFRDHPGIMEGTEKPEYGKVVDIVTRDSLRELITPGLLAVLTPIAVGFGLGVGALGAYLAGTIATGVLMAVFLSNSGGAWDNAKKFVEDGNYGGKGSEAHSATVIGDTVGDPFKDTAGPAINPLIKVMNLVALLVAPSVVSLYLAGNAKIGWAIAFGAVVIIVAAVLIAKSPPDRGRGRPDRADRRRRALGRRRRLERRRRRGDRGADQGLILSTSHAGPGGTSLQGLRRLRPLRDDRTVPHDSASLDRDAAERVRRTFLDAGFTADGLLALLGASAYAALARDEPVPARRALESQHGADALLARLFVLGEQVPVDPVRRELPLDDLVALGLVEVGGQVRAVVDVRPYGESDTDWYVVSDHGPDSAGRVAGRGRGRPRARRRRGVADAGADHAADPGRSRARPRHRVRGAGAAPRSARRQRRGHRPQPPGAACSPP